MRTFSLSVTKWLVVIAVTALLAPALFHSVAYGTDDNWLTTTGNWNIGTNWSTGSPPTSSQNAVITDAGGAVSEDISATIQDLTIGSGDSLSINDSIALTVSGSTITNNGTLSMQGADTQTFLKINGSVTLTGTGSLTLSIASNNIIEGTASSNTLTNQETIQGAGNIGNGMLTLVNSGTIDALPGNPQLIIQTSGGTTNTGTLEATGGNRARLEQPMQFGDFVAWQEARRASGVSDAARDFWARRMMWPSTSFFMVIIRSFISSTKITM